MMRSKILSLTLLLVVTLWSTGISQDQPPIAVMTMMDASNGSEYSAVELDIWMPVHAQRVRDGEIMGWYFYAIALDNGEDFNYATVEVYPNWNAMEKAYQGIDKVFEEVHGADQDSLDWMFDQTEKTRDIVKSIRWIRQDAVMGENLDDQKYFILDWMDIKPGHGSDYMRMEREFYKPVHQKRVDAGKIKSWALYSKMGYSESPGSIDAVTVAGYENWGDMWNSYPENAWEEAHPGVDSDAIGERMMSHRVMTGSSVLRIIDWVDVDNVED